MFVRLLPLRSLPPLPVYRNHSPSSLSSSYLHSSQLCHINSKSQVAHHSIQSSSLPANSVLTTTAHICPQRVAAELMCRGGGSRSGTIFVESNITHAKLAEAITLLTLQKALLTVLQRWIGQQCQPHVGSEPPTAGNLACLSSSHPPSPPSSMVCDLKCWNS